MAKKKFAFRGPEIGGPGVPAATRANAKRTTQRTVTGDAKVSIRAGANTNRIHLDFKLSKETEERLYQALKKRH